MATSPEAIARFLNHNPQPKFEVRGKGEDWLRETIYRITGHHWVPKVSWTGDDRDIRQLEAITFSLTTQRALLYYAPRTGKTRISLDWLQHLVRCGEIRKALIIPWAPIGVNEWERQVPIFSDLELAYVRSGEGAAERFVQALEGRNHGIVCTGSTLQTIFAVKRQVVRGGRAGQNKLYADLAALRIAQEFFQALVVDEIHGVNDPSSLRFQIFSELGPEDVGECKWRLGLTGTPFGRNPYGVWSQARIVDGGQSLSRSYHFFCEAFGRRIYNHFSRTKDELVFDAAKMPLLRARMDHMVLECKLSDIQDINVLAGVVELRMGREQERAYRDLIREMIESRENDRKRTENIFVRLRQVASGYRVFTDDQGEERVVEFPSTKLEWLEEFFSAWDPEMKVVIFHEFTRSGQRICDLLRRLKIKHEWLWGGATDKAGAKDGFQYGKTPVLVANWAAGGTGVDLSAADYMCFYESPVGKIAREQTMARPMARGDRLLVVDDLVCAPVERKIPLFHAEGAMLNELFSHPKKLAELLR